MLFKTDSVNEDVTLGALLMFSWSFHRVLSGGPNNRPPLTGPSLETLTTDLSDATEGTEATGCLLSYARFTSGESYVGLRVGSGRLAHVLSTGNTKGEFSAPCSIEDHDLT